MVFLDYKTVTWSSETEGGNSLKYTTEYKCILYLEMPLSGNAYGAQRPSCVVSKSGSVLSLLETTNSSGVFVGESKSTVVESGASVTWSADNAFGAETITLHVFRLPEAP